ncbi:MAG TPA: hypothetical protein EYO33_10020 [Phycisphaerales bacterium]|nr:hypothetical protein [Phycisphaerales bacterium]
MRLTLEADVRCPPPLVADGWPIRLLTLLEQHGWWSPLAKMGDDSSGFTDIGTPEETSDQLVARGFVTTEFLGVDRIGKSRVKHHLILTVREDWVRFLYHFFPYSECTAEATIQSFSEIALQFPTVFGDAYLGRNFGIAATEIDWDPPGDFEPAWDPDEIVLFVSERFHTEHRLGCREQMERLRTEQVPSEVRRRTEADITIIEWTLKPDCIAEVRSGLERSYRWFNPENPVRP